MQFSDSKISKDVIDIAARIMRGEKIEEKKKLDPVDKDELKGKHAARDDKDIDNDGDSDESDEYLHKKRKAISKSMMYHNLTAAKMTNNFASLKDTAPLYTGTSPVIDAPFNIKRFGLSGNGNFTVSLNPVSNNIDAAGDPINFNGLELLETQTGNIQYSLSGTVNSGDLIVYELVVNNGNFGSNIKVF